MKQNTCKLIYPEVKDLKIQSDALIRRCDPSHEYIVCYAWEGTLPDSTTLQYFLDLWT